MKSEVLVGKWYDIEPLTTKMDGLWILKYSPAADKIHVKLNRSLHLLLGIWRA